MGSRVPHSIKINVLRQWLQGLPRSQIALENNIGAGTVSSIINGYKQNDPEFDKTRELAVTLKNEQGLDINLFAGAVRLRKTLEKKGLSEEQIESFIENTDTHCFRHNIRFVEFVDTINELSALSDSFGIQLDQLPKHIQDEENRLEALREQIKFTIHKRDRLLKEYDLTTQDLKGYDRFKPQLHNYISTERELQNCRLQLASEISTRKMARYIDQYDLNILNEHLDKPVSAKKLLNMLDYVRYSPIKNIDIIKSMQEKVSEHPALLLIDQPSENK